MKIDNIHNKKSPIKCLEPSIVMTSDWFKRWQRYRYLHVMDNNGQYHSLDFHEYKTHPRLANYLYSICAVTLDSLDNFGFGPQGEIREPLFYAFKCGHCALCREAKSKEYQFRATAETNTYPLNPLFLTITYNDASLPADGVSLDDLQKYFKRLRWRLDKVYGLPTDFRYLAVSEYGTKKGRPHYHVILWNFPVDKFKSERQAYSCIRFAWLDYKLDERGKRRYVNAVRNGKSFRFPAMRSRGGIKILPVLDGCVGYITKYFGKDSGNICNYKNKTFLVSSRGKGGIGSSWILQQKEFVDANPGVQLQCVDPNSNTTFKSGITGYLKNILYPSKSRHYGRYYSLASRMALALERLRVIQHYARPYEKFFQEFRADKSLQPIYRGLRYFYFHTDLEYLKTQYTFYHYSKADYNQLATDFKNELALLVFGWSILKDQIEELNYSFYLRNKWIKDAADKAPVQYYDLESEQDRYDYNFQKYYEKCYF